jgi:hypothetical protein
MRSLKTIIIGVTGSSFRGGATDLRLNASGLSEMRHAVTQLAEQNRQPRIIYCSTDPAHIASAHMLAVHPSVKYVIPSKTLCFGRDDWVEEKRRLQAKMREALKTKQGAIEFCQKMSHVEGDTEEVIILTGQCWGDSFGKAGIWNRGALYSFDLEKQSIEIVGVSSVSI